MYANIDVLITVNKPSCNMGAGKPLPYDLGYCAEYGLGCTPFREFMILPL
jgi:hypothetical protein